MGGKPMPERWKAWLTGEWRLRIIVALGLLGMALILLSQFIGPDKAGKPADTSTAEFVSEEYIAELEAKLTALIAGIDGVGEARVMVTLESGVEYVYAQEEKRNTDLVREEEPQAASARVSEKENVEQTYIFVEQDGQQQPLLRMALQPKVQGVVVVCEGADKAQVKQDLIHVVTTALNISSNRVCVVKIETDSMQ